jgi:lambda family phage portal protein
MNILDSFIGFVNPSAGARRMRNRYAMDQLDKLRRYDAAGNGRRFDGWKTGNVSANRELEMSLSKLIARSRDLDRNNPYAKRAVERIADNVVGMGIRPTFSKDVAKLRKAWKKWAEGDSKECDFDGRMNYYGLQWLAMRTVAESGSCIIRKRRTDKNKKSGIPIQLQIFEPDIIDTTKNFDVIASAGNTGGYCIQGIEFTGEGKRKGYWLWEKYPTDLGIHSLESKLVPAEDIIHVYQLERPGQCHGVPFGSAGFLRLRDFDDFEDAELVRQKIAACFTAFVSESADYSTGTTKKNSLTERMEPGIIQKINPGEQVSFSNPPTKEGIDAYSRQVLQGIAAGYGVTYEALTGDMRNVNFSSGRMGWLEFQRTISRYQTQMFIPLFCSESFAWFLEGAQVASIYGKADLDADWTPPRREMIDPQKEIAALSAAVRNGFQDWGEAVTELGYEPETILERIEKYNKLFDEKGIVLDSDPRKTAAGGKLQLVPTDETTDPNTGSEDTPAQAAKKKAAK